MKKLTSQQIALILIIVAALAIVGFMLMKNFGNKTIVNQGTNASVLGQLSTKNE